MPSGTQGIVGRKRHQPCLSVWHLGLVVDWGWNTMRRVITSHHICLSAKVWGRRRDEPWKDSSHPQLWVRSWCTRAVKRLSCKSGHFWFDSHLGHELNRWSKASHAFSVSRSQLPYGDSNTHSPVLQGCCKEDNNRVYVWRTFNNVGAASAKCDDFCFFIQRLVNRFTEISTKFGARIYF